MRSIVPAGGTVPVGLASPAGAVLLVSIALGVVGSMWLLTDRVGWWVLPVVWLQAMALSAGVYLLPTAVEGRNSFHQRVVLGAIVSVVLAVAASRRAKPGGTLVPAILAAVVGVMTPPALLFAFLAIACGGGSCFS